MKNILLSLGIAAVIASGFAPANATAEQSYATRAVRSTPEVTSGTNGQWIVISGGEEDMDKLNQVLADCGIHLNSLFQNICPDLPQISRPECPTPEITQPESPAPEPSAPETSAPETPAPEPSAPEASVPETSAPEISAPEATAPETSAPETSAPEPSAPETSAPETSAPGETAVPSESIHPYILRIVELVNEERAQVGLNPVTLDASASQAAAVRAREIVTSFSHTRPDGRSCFTALTEAGVNYRLAGENIAWGQSTPEQVMEGWMNSSGHRANILHESFTHIGVGYYQQGGVNYWTQLFFQ